MIRDLTFSEPFLINFLKKHSVNEWNAWMKRLFDANLICPVWRADDKAPGTGFYFDFRGANFSHQQLDSLDLTGCDLVGTNFTGASLKGAILRWTPAAVFVGADLRDAQFVCAEISAVDFTDAILTGVIFDDVRYNTAMPPKGLPEELLRCCIAEVEDD